MRSSFNQIQKHIIVALIILYALISYFWAWLAVENEWIIAFGYQEDIRPEWFTKYLPALQLQTFAILIGYVAKSKVPLKSIAIKKINAKLYSSSLFLLIILGYILYLIFAATAITEIQNNSGEIQRVLASKSSQLSMIAIVILAIVNRQRRRFGKLSLFLAMIVGFIFGYVDGTRSAIIPMAIVFIYGIFGKDRFSLYLSLSCFPLAVTFLGLGREAVRDYQRDFDFTLEALVVGFQSFSLSYFFAFSQAHFIYSVENYQGVFSLRDLFYSVTPIPTIINPIQPDQYDWRLGPFRPLGAQQSLYILSPVMSFTFNLLVGALCYSTYRIESHPIRSLASILLLLSFCSSYQYNLRGVQWFLWITFILIQFSAITHHRKASEK